MKLRNRFRELRKLLSAALTPFYLLFFLLLGALFALVEAEMDYDC